LIIQFSVFLKYAETTTPREIFRLMSLDKINKVADSLCMLYEFRADGEDGDDEADARLQMISRVPAISFRNYLFLLFHFKNMLMVLNYTEDIFIYVIITMMMIQRSTSA
jgi:hypothetical protein